MTETSIKQFASPSGSAALRYRLPSGPEYYTIGCKLGMLVSTGPYPGVLFWNGVEKIDQDNIYTESKF